MSSFTDVKRTKRAPLCIERIPPSAFADEWDARPADDIVVGLRLLSESDILNAQREAAKVAAASYAGEDGKPFDMDSLTDDFNDRLVCEAVARAMCDPNDVDAPHPLFPAAQDMLPYALTPPAIRFLWDRLHAATVSGSPVVLPAEDEHVLRLGKMLGRGVLSMLSPAKQMAARKLLMSVLDDCEPFATTDDDVWTNEPTDDEASVYVVTGAT